MWLMRATHSRGTSSVLLPLLPPRMPFAACFVSLRRCWPTCIACSPVLPRAFRSSTRPSLPAALTRAPPHPPAPTPHPRPSCFTCLRRRRAAAGCAARLRSPRSSSLTAHAGLSQSSHRNYFFLLVEKDTVSFTRTCSLEAQVSLRSPQHAVRHPPWRNPQPRRRPKGAPARVLRRHQRGPRMPPAGGLGQPARSCPGRAPRHERLPRGV